MKRIRTIVRNPFLNEYVYTCLHNVTAEQKKNLSKATLNILRTAITAKAFSSNSTKDEKEIVLTELGYQFATIIYPKGIQSVHVLKQLMRKVEEGRTSEGIQHLAKEKVFVTTDKETMYYLSLAAATINHKNYFMNLDLLKSGHALKRWSKRVDSEINEESLEGMEYTDLIDRIISESISMSKVCEGFLGITERDLVVLQYFHENRQVYLNKDRIESKFKGVIKGVGVTTAVKKLLDNNYIKKSMGVVPVRYTITSAGISIVRNFRNRVLNPFQ